MAVIGPCSKKQEMILNSDADVLICGGAAGCVDKDTEFLSHNGWKKISEYNKNDLVLQYDRETRIASFVKPLEYIKVKSDGFFHIKTQRGLDQMISKEHKVLYEDDVGELKIKIAEQFVSEYINEKFNK